MIKNNKKGFTIIEVVLVLAIAGLIFLMVFIALPALQRSQRNTQRRQDMSRFVSAITTYASNNKGKLPFEGAQSNGAPTSYDDENTEWVKKYIMAGNVEEFQDPDGTYYAFTRAYTGAAAYNNNQADLSSSITTSTYANHHVVVAVPGHSCGDGEGRVQKASGDRFFALFMVLEGGSITCADNQ